jgi:hypothetical protein
MARDLTAGVATAVAATTVRPVLFYEGEYSTGILRLWSGLGSFSWNAQTWTGAGQMLGLAPVEELSDVRAVGFAVSLSADASALLSLNLGAARQGLLGKVWIGFFDSAGALIDDPYLAFQGRFDVPDILDAGEQATISARYESRLADLDRPRERRYTDEDQSLDYPTDPGFEFVTRLPDKQVIWGGGGINAEVALRQQLPDNGFNGDT